MSAWIVSQGHIDVLVQGLIAEGIITPREANAWGRRLWEENRHSVAIRYPADADGEWPGPIGLTRAEIAGYLFRGVEAPLADGAVLAAIHCLEYQCAEWAGYEDEPGIVAVEILRRRIEDRHPAGWEGWREWPWGFEDVTEAIDRTPAA